MSDHATPHNDRPSNDQTADTPGESTSDPRTATAPDGQGDNAIDGPTPTSANAGARSGSGSDTPTPPQRSPGAYLGLVARGFAMGAADVVPGVSGGTMAFIMGIYEELLISISAFTRRETLRLFVTLGWRRALQILPWRFLMAVGTGIALAILSLARVLEWALTEHPVLVWSFFFGLVVASVVVIARTIRWEFLLGLAGAASAALAYWIVGLVPTQTPETALYLFFSGAVAICAMILPGISGSFILVILGKYEFILSAVNDRDLLTIAIVGAGAAVGILTFARLVSWLFRTRRSLTVAALTGLMLGSLRKIWPWKEVQEWMTDRHGELVPMLERNIMPEGPPTQLLAAATLMAVGFAFVWLLDRQASGGMAPGS